MLTPGQKNVLQFIQAEQRKGLTPSTREIQEHFGFASQTSVMQYLAALERKGFLQRHARKARALITAAPHSQVIDIPIYGEIPAGMATLAEQNIEGHVALDLDSLNASRRCRTFALRVRGDSMIDENIQDGDIIIVASQKTADNGQVVVALIDGNYATVKKFYREPEFIRLEPANPQFKPIFIKTPERIQIQGVVRGLIRKFSQPAVSGQLSVVGCSFGTLYLVLCTLMSN